MGTTSSAWVHCSSGRGAREGLQDSGGRGKEEGARREGKEQRGKGGRERTDDEEVEEAPSVGEEGSRPVAVHVDRELDREHDPASAQLHERSRCIRVTIHAH